MSIPGDVKKAIELLHSQSESGLSIRKLAALCGVAPRTLQKHFKQFVGMTPAELRFEARMGQARRELLRAKANVSIAEIATSCGIEHLGRFASLYRKKFGESPSATLRRRGRLVLCQTGFAVPPVALDRPVIAIHKFECSDKLLAAAGFSVADGIRVGLVRDRWFCVGSMERARYHLRGNVRHEKDRVQITASLTSSETGHRIWADRWHGALSDTVAFEERVTARIAKAVRRTLFNSEIDRVSSNSAKTSTGWELTMKAFPYAMRIEREALSRALEELERAMELMPGDGLPVALAAWCHAQRGSHHLSAQPAVEKLSGLEFVARGEKLNSDDAVVQSLFGGACALAGEFDRAAFHIDRALSLDGGSAWAWNRLGMLDVYRGNFNDATECFQIARDLDHRNPLNFMCSIGIGSAHFEWGRYDDAARWFARAIAEHPAAIWVNRFNAPALLLAGQRDKATRAFAELTKSYSDLSIAAMRQAIPYRQTHWDCLAEGLTDLGMPL